MSDNTSTVSVRVNQSKHSPSQNMCINLAHRLLCNYTMLETITCYKMGWLPMACRILYDRRPSEVYN